MPTTAFEAKDLVREVLACSQNPGMDVFARAFLSSLSARDLERFRRDDLVGAIVHAHGLLASSPKPQVLLINPGFEEFGWQSDYTVCIVHHPDIPFLVDSLRIELLQQEIEVHTQANLVLDVSRSGKGALQDLRPANGDSGSRESLIWFEIDRTTQPDVLRKTKVALQQVLQDLRVVVDDFDTMRSKATAIADHLSTSALPPSDISEVQSFLNWLADDHFTFIGYEYFELGPKGALKAHSGSSLGLSRNQTLTDGQTTTRIRTQKPANTDDLVVFVKAPVRSTIHRAVYPDVVSILALDRKGQVIGEHRLIGLYTARVYVRPASEIPLIRAKLEYVIEASGFSVNTHNGKVLRQILQVYPRDELFQSSRTHLSETVNEIVKLHERKQLRLFLDRDRFGFFCSALLYIPRDLYTTEARITIQALLSDALDAEDSSFSTFFSESIFARVHMIFRLKPNAPEVNVRQLEQQVSDTVSSWADQFREALESELGEERANTLYARYGRGFPAGYREDFSPRRAVFDIQRADSLNSSDDVAVSLYQNLDAASSAFRLKLFSLEHPIPLSDALPLIEHLGAWVLAESPYVVRGKDRTVWIHDYQLELPGSMELGQIRESFQEALLAAWRKETESDRFCQLVVLSGLNWRDVALIRALTRYLKQIGFELSQSWMAETLSNYPQIARDLVGLFHARFDPKRKRSKDLEEKVLDGLLAQLDGVAGLNEDRLIRRLIELITVTVRTNFFQKTNDQYLPYFSFKLRPAGITDIPKPVPMYEIFVYSPRVEGVHLRGGPVARGGLRWSDRGEDYRTEVLGLVKAQQVKNSVIVPVGAKGGFFPKQLPSGDRDAIQTEAIACYEIFIAGLLDLTDNLVAGELVPPTQTRCHDDPDPYLVVAADKGTATFSDIANRISESRQFWLGDAFASGGSAGYDHKKMGITAKGAWVSVQRHFREMGRNCQTEPFTCIGIGDMSGDVFGNGLLLSDQTCLVAAFNHMHIFLDPTPDPAKSFAERQRLFALPRSGWADYDTALISSGGGVFERAAKQITLSDAMARVLDCEPGVYTPTALLSLILKAPIDLLWNGGIGTYVKAATETHLEVGDKANDGLRVNGRDLRAKIIGEGGNLGFTQRGRVEAALNGVRVNTDFIDNAGGVDCSDHEVNIKIHLNQMMAEGDLTRKQRDRILAQMTDEVSELVLHNNYRQAQAVSLARLHATETPDDLLRFMQSLAEQGRLDRELEFLPSDEVMHERMANRQTLTGPELSVLISYAKNELKEAFAVPEIATDPVLAARALSAFPASLVKRDRAALLNHQLVAEIAATQWANMMVNMMGISFAKRMQEASGRSLIEVLKAFAVAQSVYQFESAWAGVEVADGQLPAESQLMEMRHLHRLVRRATRWLLRNRPLTESCADEIGRYQDAMNSLLSEGLSLLPDSRQEAVKAEIQALVEQGVEPQAAHRIRVGLAFTQLISIAEVTQVSGRKLMDVASVFVNLGEHLGLLRFSRLVNTLSVANNWEALAREAFRDDLNASQQRLAAALSMRKGKPDALVHAFLDEHRTDSDRWLSILDRLESTVEVSYPMLSVAMRELKALEARIVL